MCLCTSSWDDYVDEKGVNFGKGGGIQKGGMETEMSRKLSNQGKFVTKTKYRWDYLK